MDEFDRAMRVSKETRKLNDIFVENQLHKEFSRAFTSILSDLQLDIEIRGPEKVRSSIMCSITTRTFSLNALSGVVWNG